MSDINENSTMSTEQKFLGVKAKIGTKPDEVVEPEGEIDIEIMLKQNQKKKKRFLQKILKKTKSMAMSMKKLLMLTKAFKNELIN